MKTHLFLYPAVVSCLGLGPQKDPFIKLCGNLELTPDTGLLSGICNSGKTAIAQTYVDLNECLAWGAKEEGALYNELFPAEA